MRLVKIIVQTVIFVICDKYVFLCFGFPIVTRSLNLILNLKGWLLVSSHDPDGKNHVDGCRDALFDTNIRKCLSLNVGIEFTVRGNGYVFLYSVSKSDLF